MLIKCGFSDQRIAWCRKLNYSALKKYAKMLMHRIYNTLAYHLFVCGKQVKTDI
jgi:hypothetical protein